MSKLLKVLLKKVQQKHIFTLVDVGTMGGLEAEWKSVSDDIRSIGFEPDAREADR